MKYITYHIFVYTIVTSTSEFHFYFWWNINFSLTRVTKLFMGFQGGHFYYPHPLSFLQYDFFLRRPLSFETLIERPRF